MKVGLALRGDQSYASSAEALEICLAEGELGAVRPLVNSYLLSGQKGKATAAIQQGIEKSNDPARSFLPPNSVELAIRLMDCRMASICS